MLSSIRFYIRRARELRASGQFFDAVIARLRAGRAASRFNAQQAAGRVYKEYSADLPVGYSAKKITLRLSVPVLDSISKLAFNDHTVDEEGRTTSSVLALTIGGFAISPDLGKTWKLVKIEGHPEHRFFQIKDIGEGEFLVQGLPSEHRSSKNRPLDLMVVNEEGKVLVKHPMHGHRWHGSRSAAMVGGTIMFAEYLSNVAINGRRPVGCKVWRSRDRGRTWHTVFEMTGGQIRHFHFLQPRPKHPGEWWLTSGDHPPECQIWVTKDDGDSWENVSHPEQERVEVSGEQYKRDLFRLTDMVWLNGEVVWGTDDSLRAASPPGARVFRSAIGRRLKPELVGIGKWHFRNVIDIGEYLLFLSQRSNVATAPPEDKRPSVYLMPKQRVQGAPAMVHVCDLDAYPTRDRPGFTFSKASRAAVGGTFFSYRSSEDVFPAGHRILEWNVRLE